MHMIAPISGEFEMNRNQGRKHVAVTSDGSQAVSKSLQFHDCAGVTP